MSKLNLEKAKEILKKYTTDPHLIIHAQAVSAAMGAMADYYREDRDHWEAIGYLHDVDYEKYPCSFPSSLKSLDKYHRDSEIRSLS